jgi:hypothetical protein
MIQTADNKAFPSCWAYWGTRMHHGGCNFCSRNTEKIVLVVRSRDERRHLEVRFCKKCLSELMLQERIAR